MSGREGDVLERNVRALLRGAYRPAAPSAEFRRRLREEFLRRAGAAADSRATTRRGRTGEDAPRGERHRRWSRPLLLGAGLAAAGLVLFAWWVDRADDVRPQERLARGPSALDGGGIDPEAGPADGRAVALGATEAERLAAEAERPPGEVAAQDSAEGAPAAPEETTGSCDLRVRVVDAETGAPLPEFALWSRHEAPLPRVEFARSVAGREGVAAVSGLRAGAYTILVEAEGYAAWRQEGLALDPAAIRSLEARLERGTEVRGEVRDASTGAPIAGALVVAELDGPEGALALDPAAIVPPRAHAITDAAGRYAIPHVSTRAQRLRVLHPDYAAAWSVELAAAGADAASGRPRAPAAVELSAGGSLEGWLERAGGAPDVGAEVVLSLVSMNRALPVLAYLRVVTDAEGRFVAEHLPPGFYVVVTRDLDGGVQVRQVTVEEGGRARVRFGAALGSPSLRGLLVGPDGAPKSGYQVAVVPEGPGVENFEDWVVALTDHEGRFVFEALDPGTYAVYADRSTTSMTRRDSIEIRAGEEGVLRVALQGGALEGRLESEVPATGAAARGVDAMLILVRADSGARSEPGGAPWLFHGKGDAGPDGAYRFEHLPTGRYRVAVVGQSVRCGGYLSEAVELLGDETRRVPLMARPGVQVQPVVRDGAGAPVAEAVVLFFDAAGDEFPYHPAPLTDAAGRAPATSLRAGRWTVEASAPGYLPVRRPLDLDPAIATALEVPLVLEAR